MLTTYGVLFLIGVGLSVFSFLTGSHVSHGHGHGLFHHGGHHAAHHVVTSHHGPTTHDGAAKVEAGVTTPAVSPFNFAAATAFLAWFGGTGVVLHQLTAWAELPIVLSAALTGILGGTAINRFLGALLSREQPLSATTLVGMVGRIASPIRPDGTGEVVFVLNGTRKVSAARSDNGTAMEKGTEVVITRFEKGIAYVSTWNELTASSQLS